MSETIRRYLEASTLEDISESVNCKSGKKRIKKCMKSIAAAHQLDPDALQKSLEKDKQFIKSCASDGQDVAMNKRLDYDMFKFWSESVKQALFAEGGKNPDEIRPTNSPDSPTYDNFVDQFDHITSLPGRLGFVKHSPPIYPDDYSFLKTKDSDGRLFSPNIFNRRSLLRSLLTVLIRAGVWYKTDEVFAQIDSGFGFFEHLKSKYGERKGGVIPYNICFDREELVCAAKLREKKYDEDKCKGAYQEEVEVEYDPDYLEKMEQFGKDINTAMRTHNRETLKALMTERTKYRAETANMRARAEREASEKEAEANYSDPVQTRKIGLDGLPEDGRRCHSLEKLLATWRGSFELRDNISKTNTPKLPRDPTTNELYPPNAVVEIINSLRPGRPNSGYLGYHDQFYSRDPGDIDPQTSDYKDSWETKNGQANWTDPLFNTEQDPRPHPDYPNPSGKKGTFVTRTWNDVYRELHPLVTLIAPLSLSGDSQQERVVTVGPYLDLCRFEKIEKEAVKYFARAYQGSRFTLWRDNSDAKISSMIGSTFAQGRDRLGESPMDHWTKALNVILDQNALPADSHGGFLGAGYEGILSLNVNSTQTELMVALQGCPIWPVDLDLGEIFESSLKFAVRDCVIGYFLDRLYTQYLPGLFKSGFEWFGGSSRSTQYTDWEEEEYTNLDPAHPFWNSGGDFDSISRWSWHSLSPTREMMNNLNRMRLARKSRQPNSVKNLSSEPMGVYSEFPYGPFSSAIANLGGYENVIQGWRKYSDIPPSAYDPQIFISAFIKSYLQYAHYRNPIRMINSWNDSEKELLWMPPLENLDKIRRKQIIVNSVGSRLDQYYEWTEQHLTGRIDFVMNSYPQITNCYSCEHPVTCSSILHVFKGKIKGVDQQSLLNLLLMLDVRWYVQITNTQNSPQPTAFHAHDVDDSLYSWRVYGGRFTHGICHIAEGRGRYDRPCKGLIRLINPRSDLVSNYWSIGVPGMANIRSDRPRGPRPLRFTGVVWIEVKKSPLDNILPIMTCVAMGPSHPPLYMATFNLPVSGNLTWVPRQPGRPPKGYGIDAAIQNQQMRAAFLENAKAATDFCHLLSQKDRFRDFSKPDESGNDGIFSPDPGWVEGESSFLWENFKMSRKYVPVNFVDDENQAVGIFGTPTHYMVFDKLSLVEKMNLLAPVPIGLIMPCDKSFLSQDAIGGEIRFHGSLAKRVFFPMDTDTEMILGPRPSIKPKLDGSDDGKVRPDFFVANEIDPDFDGKASLPHSYWPGGRHDLRDYLVTGPVKDEYRNAAFFRKKALAYLYPHPELPAQKALGVHRPNLLRELPQQSTEQVWKNTIGPFDGYTFMYPVSWVRNPHGSTLATADTGFRGGPPGQPIGTAVPVTGMIPTNDFKVLKERGEFSAYVPQKDHVTGEDVDWVERGEKKAEKAEKAKKARCGCTTKAGSRCKKKVADGSKYCRVHRKCKKPYN
jgi:hypothetical protein